MNKNTKNQYFTLALILLIFIITITAFYYQYLNNKKLASHLNDLNNHQAELSEKVADIETVLLSTQENNLTLAEALTKAEEEARKLENKFDRVNENVNDLEKITTTDRELLQKYSKIFFLNEHYVPSDLKTISSKWTYNESREYQIHADVWPYLRNLLEDAEDEGLDLKIISAFRSFDEQAQIKGFYTMQYGSGANTFSADQGYSEHQLGTTVDFTNPDVAATFSGFSNTEEYRWLQNNAHKYGFTLSYPESNKHYQYEPWHWRFVGVDLATDLHKDKKFFYDLDQREIDKYIVSLFD